MPVIRLDKMLSGQGFGTRREIKELLRAGRVRVNGAPAKSGDYKIDAATDQVSVNGSPVSYKEHIYIMLNKPAGVVSASNDKRQRTVLDLLPGELSRPGLFPVGRLDKDTEGLLLITDDGPLAHDLLSPRKHVEKRYFARLDGMVDAQDVEAFRAGVVLETGEICLPAKLEPDGDTAYVGIMEGKFHQIKRMFETRGRHVVYLKRLSMGPLALDENLLPGQCRELSEDELHRLKTRENLPI